MKNDFRTLILNLGLVCLVVGGAFTAIVCHGHDHWLHVRLSETAFLGSDGVNAYLRECLGSEHSPFTESPVLVFHRDDFYVDMMTPSDWISQGSYWEDERLYGGYEMRTVDHFYTLKPHTMGRVSGLTDAGEPAWNLFGLPSGIVNSFDWAWQREIEGPYYGRMGVGIYVGQNTETWQNARDYQFAALTSAMKSTRDESMAHMLYALGHILHLNRDLTSLDHVRNDNHFYKEHKYIENYGEDNFKRNPNWFVLPPSERRGWARWRDSGFQKLVDFWDRNLYSDWEGKDMKNALDNDAHGGTGMQLGLAEFSNGNFLGEDAIYAEYFKPGNNHYFPFPSRTSSTSYPQVKQRIFAHDLEQIDYADGTSGNRVYLRKVADGIRGFRHSALPYLVTMRLDSPQSLQWSYSEGRPTVNDPNVLQDYHSILIPKAFEYSAGILDYFFRGKLETTVTPNADGTYELAIQNLSGTDLKGGTFELYWDDLDGVRSRVTEFSVPWDNQSDLPDGETVVATLRPPAGLVEKYILVYKGTIGTSGGNPLDPVDETIAIATETIPCLCRAEVSILVEDCRSLEVSDGNPLKPGDVAAYGTMATSLVAQMLAGPGRGSRVITIRFNWYDDGPVEIGRTDEIADQPCRVEAEAVGSWSAPLAQRQVPNGHGGTISILTVPWSFAATGERIVLNTDRTMCRWREVERTYYLDPFNFPALPSCDGMVTTSVDILLPEMPTLDTYDEENWFIYIPPPSGGMSGQWSEIIRHESGANSSLTLPECCNFTP